MTDTDYVARLRKMTDRELIEDAREQAEGFSGKSGCVYTSEWYTRVADRLEALLAENERLKAQVSEWVSVDERLPEYVGDYLVVLDGTREMAVLFFDKWPPSWTDDDDTEYKVTHWMPTPFRPEEVE